MIFLELVQAIVVLLVVGLTVTQIIVPILTGLPILPVFKKKNEEIDQELAQAKEEVDLAKKKNKLAALREEIKSEEERSKNWK